MIIRNGHGAMSQELDPHADSSRPMAYQIRITGQLDARWADRFEGLTITLDGGDTLIQAGVSDVKSAWAACLRQGQPQQGDRE
jgi:hypothetical protein